jgi:hypothetical protein
MNQPTPQTPQAPTTPQAPAPAPQSAAASAIAANKAAYLGEVARRDELQSQLGTLQDQRRAIANRFRQGGAAQGADETGLQAQLTLLDKQIGETFVKIAEANVAVANAAAQPGSVPPPPPPVVIQRNGPPEEFFMLGGMIIFFVLFPMAIAASRRIWRRAGQIMKMPPELNERMTRLEQAVESVAIEVERVGEGQRFVTNLFIEGGQQMLGPGPMNTLEIRERERVEAGRKGAGQP